jgi:carbon storage regulator CsrA
MLVVHRKIGERIVLSGGIEIAVVALAKGGVRLAVTAPKDVWIARGEVHDAAVSANAAAAAASPATELMTTFRLGDSPDAPEEPQ